VGPERVPGHRCVGRPAGRGRRGLIAV
jgi:hypothetical protein